MALPTDAPNVPVPASGDLAAGGGPAARADPAVDADPATLAELVTLIAMVAGVETGRAAGITAATCLHDDLELESVELTGLAVALRDRYGPAVDIDAYFVGLDLDELIDLTVGDLAAYVTRCRAGTSPDRRGA